MKLFEFTLTVCGWGETVEEAWETCKENFDIDDEPIPESEVIDEKD